MNKFETIQVVMLPTKDASNLHLLGNELGYTNIPNSNPLCKQQHLYFLSNEPIKEGGWCFEKYNGESLATKNHPKFIDNEGNTWWLRNDIICTIVSKEYKKIISTTDSSLTNNCNCKITCKTIKEFCNEYKILPQPSQDFIKYYIEQYNQGNIITEVEVGYYPTNEFINNVTTNKPHYKLSINEDNTITIGSDNIKQARLEKFKNKYIDKFPVEDDWDNIIDNFLIHINELRINVDHRLLSWLKENYNPPTKKT